MSARRLGVDAARSRANPSIEIRLSDLSCSSDDEGRRGISRDASRQVHFARLARPVRRNGDHEVGVGQPGAPFARVQLSRIGRGATRRGDDHVDRRGALRGRRDRRQ